ncbi:MAG TPA: 4Fe-4S dicluster domain-containing protein [Anaerolineaceae bacterium]
MKSKTIRSIRQVFQVLSFILFIGLLFFAGSLPSSHSLASLFLRLDPLTALTSMLASRSWIPHLGVAILTVLVTLVFGRVWCGWFCPMGSLLDWITPRHRKPAKTGSKTVSERWRIVKYFLLLLMIVTALFGIQSFSFLDPISLLTRSMAGAVIPAARTVIFSSLDVLYQVEFLYAPLDFLYQYLVYPLFKEVIPSFELAVPIFIFFAAILGLNWVAERFWCRYLCPLGGLLGLLSRISLFRRVVNQDCTGCGLCARRCPTGTINPDQNYQSDPAECTVCYDCVADCSKGGTRFQWMLPGWKPASSQSYDIKRREAVLALGAGVASAALAGVEPIQRRQPANLIRPPGARTTDFESLCIRCGECIKVCPTQGLQPTLLEAGWQNALTPRLVPRLGQCSFNCNACGTVCPTGAIPFLSIAEKQQKPIGLARVDQSRCLPWAYDVPCIVCEEMCPLPDKAIRLHEVETTNSQGETILLQRPYVVKEYCIGCGICEYKCPMGGEAAIRVFAPTDPGGFISQ